MKSNASFAIFPVDGQQDFRRMQADTFVYLLRQINVSRHTYSSIKDRDVLFSIGAIVNGDGKVKVLDWDDASRLKPLPKGQITMYMQQNIVNFIHDTSKV